MDTSPLLPEQTENVNVEVNKDDENYKLGGRSPIATLFSLLAGPLLSQVTNSIYGIVNTIYIAKGVGQIGLEVLTSIFIYDYLVWAFSCLLTASASSHISYLFGQKREKEAAQVIADLFKFLVILSLIYPSIVIPSAKPVVKWFSGSEKIANEAFKYLRITSSMSCFYFSFNLLCGILQGEGRTWLYGMMNLLALFLDMLILLPLFIFKFHWGIWCAGLSMTLSQMVPMTILLILLFSGKMSVNISWKNFTSKFSPESYNALKVGFVSFIMGLTEAFPQFATQKFIQLVGSHIGKEDAALTICSIISRLYMLSLCVLIAFDSAYMPSASYAYGRRLYKRVTKLSFHTFWITFLWAALCSFVMCYFPVEITSLFNTNEDVLETAKEVFPMEFITLPFYTIHLLVIAFLQSIKRPTRGSIVGVLTTLIPMPVISSIIYHFKPNSLRWMFSTYIFDDLSTALMSIIGAFGPMYKICKKKDGDEPSDGFVETEKKEIHISESMDSLANVAGNN